MLDKIVIDAIQESLISGKLPDEAKKKLYEFSQWVSPELHWIIIKILEAKNSEELKKAQTELQEYMVEQKKKAEELTEQAIKNLYKAAEKDSENEEDNKEDDLLKELEAVQRPEGLKKNK